MMPDYLISKDELVKIVTDTDLASFIPDLKDSIKTAQDLLYNELPKHKNCCQRDWKALGGYANNLAEYLKKHTKEAVRFKEYMKLKYNVPQIQKSLFFFRWKGELQFYQV